MKKKKKRRRLRKRVYVLLAVIILIIAVSISIVIKKKNETKYQLYNEEVETTTMKYIRENSVYTYDQNYFAYDTKTYISLNDFYNVYSHIDQSKMQLNEKKGIMSFTLNDLKIDYDYKHNQLLIKEGTLNTKSQEYLNELNINKTKIDLNTINCYAFIHDGEVYIEQNILEYILLNYNYIIDLKNSTVNKL